MTVARGLAAGALGGAVAAVGSVVVAFAWLGRGEGALKDLIVAWTAMMSIGFFAMPVGALTGMTLVLPYTLLRPKLFRRVADRLAFALVGGAMALPAHGLVNAFPADSKTPTDAGLAMTAALFAIGSLAGVWPFRSLLAPAAARPKGGVR